MRTLLAMLLLVPALALAPAFAEDAAKPAPTQPAPAQPAAAPAKPALKKGEVYKWTDDKGVVHYTDKPPTKDATPANLPRLQTYKHGTNPDLRKFAPPGDKTEATVAGPQVQIVTPSREETFRSGERTVPVAVMVTPSLQADQKLVYQLDGKAMGSATTDTSFAMTEVDRGAHSVVVTVVDDGGQELSRSLPVTFYMQPPIAKKR